MDRNKGPFLVALQNESAPWVAHNFGNRPSWQPLMGMVEEVAEMLIAEDEHEVLDGIADFVIFAADYCNAMGWDLHTLFNERFEPRESVLRLSRTETVVYCVGKMQHHYLKDAQNIRGDSAHHHERGRHFLRGALWAIFELFKGMTFDADESAEPFLKHVDSVWQKVRQRDWTKAPGDGQAR